MAKPSFLVFSFLIVLSACLLQSLCIGQGLVIEESVISNNNLRIRVERRKDLYSLMHYWYVFSSARTGELQWREITRHLYGEPVDLPTKQIRFIGNDVAYLFFQLKFAVTVDAGKSWSVVDFGHHPSFNPENLDYSKIADVELKEDGTGHIIMFRYNMRQGQEIKFFTKDFGQHWNLSR